MLDLPVWFEVTTFVGLSLLLAADLFIVARRPHEPSVKESAAWVTFYVSLALLFGLVMIFVASPQASGEFYAGWITEYSLSVDNLFVFVLIMTQFRVPREYQQTVLMFGILVAIVLRGIFILVGVAAINQFSWVFYLFGLFLVYTAVKLAKQEAEHHVHEETYENAFIRRARRVLPMSPDYDGVKLRTMVEGRRIFTPMVIVFLAIASADVLFAVDSIPAIFGLTQEAFIVFTANVFALMGLRQLYFLLGGLLNQLVYLQVGLALILGFIGVKLVMHALHVNELPFINGGEHMESIPDIPIVVSLLVIVGTLAVTTVASLLKSRRDEQLAQRRTTEQ